MAAQIKLREFEIDFVGHLRKEYINGNGNYYISYINDHSKENSKSVIIFGKFISFLYLEVGLQ